MSNLFEGLLDEKAKEEANKSLINTIDVKNKLKAEVDLAVIGFQDLLDVVKKAHNSTKYYEQNAGDIKKQYDKIAVTLETFMEQFTQLYKEVSAAEIAYKLTKDDNSTVIVTDWVKGMTNSIVSLGSLTTIDNNFLPSPQHYKIDSEIKKSLNDAFTPLKESEKGWKGKRK